MKKNHKSFAIVLRGDKINNKNEAPLNFRLTRNKVPVYIQTGYTIDINHWDNKKGTISHKHPNSIQLRNLLTDKLQELNDKLYKIEREHSNLSSKELKQLVIKNEADNRDKFFNEVASLRIQECFSEGKIGTRDRLQSCQKNFEEFLKGKTIRLWQVDLNMLKSYESSLKIKGLKESTIQANLKFIRSILYKGYGSKEKVFNNPFIEFKFKKLKTQRNYLTLEEFKAFESAKVNSGTVMEIHKDIFLFAVRGGGIRISDILLLKWQNIIEDRTYFVAEKTNEVHSIKLTKEALKLILKYKSDTSKSSDFIFPILSKSIDYSDKEVLDKAISSATTFYNTNLKAIAKKANITKNVSSHVARHTMATLALNHGMSINQIQEILGHSNIRETMVYSKIINKELDEAIERIMIY